MRLRQIEGLLLMVCVSKMVDGNNPSITIITFLSSSIYGQVRTITLWLLKKALWPCIVPPLERIDLVELNLLFVSDNRSNRLG